jgi:hypothetical protein
VEEDDESPKVVQTENKETATSASLYRMQNILDEQETLQVGFQHLWGAFDLYCVTWLVVSCALETRLCGEIIGYIYMLLF